MIIDAHVNITENGTWFHTDHDASLSRLIDEMAAATIDHCLLISMPHVTTNRYIASVVEKYPEKFRGLGHIDFSKDVIQQVEEIHSMGLSGIKIHPRLQGISCNAPHLSKLFSHLNEKQATVLIDSYYQANHSDIYLTDLEPFGYDKLAKHHKDIKFILAHLGGHRVFDAYFLAKSNPNVYLDCSHALMYFLHTSLENDFTWVLDKLDEKTIYGSDFPEYSLSDYLHTFETYTKKNNAIRTEKIYSNITKLINF